MSVIEQYAHDQFEQLSIRSEHGVTSIIAIHDTTLGPALGGIRYRLYPDSSAAVADALRLAKSMTYKAALAGLPLGGGKSVINADPAHKTDTVLRFHGRHIRSLEGRYIPGADMGTGPADLSTIAAIVPVVSSADEDPSPHTARGVVEAMRSALAADGHDSLSGVRVAVQGAGHVGSHIVELLTETGAVVLVADADPERQRVVAERTGALAVDPDEILISDVDVVCPAGPGLVITTAVAEQMKARYVVGAANNMIANSAATDVLMQRGIVYVPDFVANAGGLISCEHEVNQSGHRETNLAGISGTVRTILGLARANHSTTVDAAVAVAEQRLAAARQSRAAVTSR